MRNAFADEITKLAEKDERIIMMPADIGNRLFNNFKEKFPKRFFNCGVAEANCISMASGMAACGLKPVTYTIAPFITSRCYEQIRLDACYNNQPIIIVAVGAGLSYASLGATHHSCEDLAILRVLPNMTILCPGDAFEVRAALRAALKHNGPVYIRLGKKNEPQIYNNIPSLKIGKGTILKNGNDVCLIGIGNILPHVIETSEMLSKHNISAQVVNMRALKPLDHKLLEKIFKDFSLVATIEEHSVLGGLGGAIAEWLTDNNSKSRLLRFGTKDKFLHKVGNQEYAREVMGITPRQIFEKIVDEYKK